MLKRLIMLGLLCSAFLLLMSLSISATAEGAPQPRVSAVETAFLPARFRQDCSGNTQAPSPTAPRPAAPAVLLRVNTSCEFLLLCCGRPYFQVFYHAFHFSDRAG